MIDADRAPATHLARSPSLAALLTHAYSTVTPRSGEHFNPEAFSRNPAPVFTGNRCRSRLRPQLWVALVEASSRHTAHGCTPAGTRSTRRAARIDEIRSLAPLPSLPTSWPKVAAPASPRCRCSSRWRHAISGVRTQRTRSGCRDRENHPRRRIQLAISDLSTLIERDG